MILESIRRLFSFDVVIELRENLVSARTFAEERRFEVVPFIAVETVEGKPVIREIGIAAKDIVGPDVRVTNPFAHPRTLVADFANAEAVIRHVIASLHGSRVGLRPAPRVVMHQLEKIEGGLTDVEERVLRELATGAGARDVVIYTGQKIHTRLDSYETIKSRAAGG